MQLSGETQKKELVRCHLSLLLVILFWGSSFASIKVILPQVPANTLALFRFIIASVALGIFFVVTKQPRPEKKHLPGMVLSGLLGIAIFNVLQNQGLRYAGATDSAILIAMSPVFIALLSWLVLREKISRLQILGIFIAFSGSVIIATNGSVENGVFDHLRLFGDLLVVLSSFVWAVFSIHLKKLLKNYPPTTIMTYSTFFGTIFLVPFSLMEFPVDIISVNWVGWLNILYLGLLASALGNLIWNDALDKISPVTAGAYLYLSPVVSAVVAFLLLHETPTINTVVGGIIILYGTYLASK